LFNIERERNYTMSLGTRHSQILCVFALIISALPALCRAAAAEKEGQETGFHDALAASSEVGQGWALALDEPERSDDLPSWLAAQAAKRATALMANDYASAYSVTEEISSKQPHLSGLMTLWDGQTATNAGDFKAALQYYRAVSENYGQYMIYDTPLGVVALERATGLADRLNNFQEAERTQRQLLEFYPEFIDPENTLARAILYHTLASSKSDSGSVFLGCSTDRPCLIGDDGPSSKGDDNTGEVLGAYSSFRFLLSASDRLMLETAKGSDKSRRDMKPTMKVDCTPQEAATGFQKPLNYDDNNRGYWYLDATETVGQPFHPGVDLNQTNDCILNFKAVADGCVTYTAAVPVGANIPDQNSNWTTMIVKHLYGGKTWRSQYAHGATFFYDIGASVQKGADIGRIGHVGADTCHLHFEIRHDKLGVDGGNFSADSTRDEVAKNYQHPIQFILAHPKYTATPVWWDENSMARTGNWTRIPTTGTDGVGDEGDFQYASTTSVSSKTNYARYSFVAPRSATYSIFAFLPYTTTRATSRIVPVSLVETTTGIKKIEVPVDQAAKAFDAWVKVGNDVVLTRNVSYYLEVATNTGESGKFVAIDDFLIVPIN
jgi:murein DD-endopeptidase MepM/ murein hydrolase activator NlpD